MLRFNHLDLFVELVVLTYYVVQVLEHLRVFVVFVHFLFEIAFFRFFIFGDQM